MDCNKRYGEEDAVSITSPNPKSSLNDRGAKNERPGARAVSTYRRATSGDFFTLRGPGGVTAEERSDGGGGTIGVL